MMRKWLTQNKIKELVNSWSIGSHQGMVEDEGGGVAFAFSLPNSIGRMDEAA